jgi:hypothetical protein
VDSMTYTEYVSEFQINLIGFNVSEDGWLVYIAFVMSLILIFSFLSSYLSTLTYFLPPFFHSLNLYHLRTLPWECWSIAWSIVLTSQLFQYLIWIVRIFRCLIHQQQWLRQNSSFIHLV